MALLLALSVLSIRFAPKISSFNSSSRTVLSDVSVFSFEFPLRLSSVDSAVGVVVVVSLASGANTSESELERH